MTQKVIKRKACAQKFCDEISTGKSIDSSSFIDPKKIVIMYATPI